MLNIKTIGLIGGEGAMGKYFQCFFKNKKFEVLSSDTNTLLSNEETAQNSDLLIFSVPIDKTVGVINEVSPFIAPETLIFDLTSIKKPPLDAMMKTPALEVVGGHPMFGPTVAFKGQTMVLTPGRGQKGLSFLRGIFEESQIKVKVTSAAKHDKLMGIVQGFTHFSDIFLARAIAKTGVDIDDLLELQSPAYRLKLVMMGRILAQDANLYGNIQLSNPANEGALQILIEAAEELFKIVRDKNLSKFIQYFQSASEYLSDFAETAMKESDFIIEKFFAKK